LNLAPQINLTSKKSDSFIVEKSRLNQSEVKNNQPDYQSAYYAVVPGTSRLDFNGWLEALVADTGGLSGSNR